MTIPEAFIYGGMFGYVAMGVVSWWEHRPKRGPEMSGGAIPMSAGVQFFQVMDRPTACNSFSEHINQQLRGLE